MTYFYQEGDSTRRCSAVQDAILIIRKADRGGVFGFPFLAVVVGGLVAAATSHGVFALAEL